jgi:Domain of unknown function (DUF362)/FlgD Ig-like domain
MKLRIFEKDQQREPSSSHHCHRAGLPTGDQKSSGGGRLARFLLPLMGLACLIWMLVRVIPKPSRAEYPCMKVAAPLAGGFIAYIAGMAIALFSLKKAAHLFGKKKSIFAAALVLCGVAAGMFTVLKTDSESHAAILATDSLFVPSDPPNSPVGVARGIFPGRVVWMWDSTAARWNGSSNYWWSETNTIQTVVDSMLSRSLRELSGQSTDAASWNALFTYFNQQHGKGSVGYAAGEKIAVKINLNNSSSSDNPKNMSLATPQTVFSLLTQLVNNAGVPDSNITFYDMIRYVPDPIYNKCKAAFPHVHFVGWSQMNGREQYVRDTTTRVHWSQDLILEKDVAVSAKGGNPTYLPTVVTKAAYLINLANLKGHSYAGITCCAKNHFGSLSVDGDDGQPYVWAPHAAGVHAYVSVHDAEWSADLLFKARPLGSYNPFVDLMGHKDLGGKTLLFIVDALYAVPDEHSEAISPTSKWLSAPFNNAWTSSLFLSQDNVAIESVCLDFLRTEQAVNPNYTLTNGAADNYLHEAAQANNPPSGTSYAPSGDGVRLQSLGVHEHWNNAIEKKYSRNLGTGNGIELVPLTKPLTSVPDGARPLGFALHQNYPNPFNPSTTISFSASQRRAALLEIYDLTGRLIRTLLNGEVAAGNHSVLWDGRNERGISVGSGVYFYRLKLGTDFVSSKKMILMR